MKSEVKQDFDRGVVEQAACAIAEADALLIGAGAGMGVDSGLPDFRGNQGFWQAYPPFAALGLSFADLANPHWFVEDPRLAWGFYGHRLNLYRSTVPHMGFAILLRWAQKKRAGAFVYTSNVDGQFQKAGFDPAQIVECHGSIHHLQCSMVCSKEIWSSDASTVTVEETTFRAKMPLPLCVHCGKIARPNILMFGDWAWLGQRTREQETRFYRWRERIRGLNLAIVECGAGTHIPSVRLMSEYHQSHTSSILIRINPRDAFGPSDTISLSCDALTALTAIDDILGSYL